MQRIVKGYRRRGILAHQLLRLCAYTSHYSMRDNKERITPAQWLPLDFDNDDAEEQATMDEEETNEMLALIAAVNNGGEAPTPQQP